MRLEILGPIRASADGQETVLRAELERALLASLLQANRTVPFERLVAAMWDDATPRNPREQLHSCVSRLRRRLTAGGFSADLIITDPDGYRTQVTVEMVDLLEFRATVSAARVASRAGRTVEARDHYRAALALWRGPALTGVDRLAVHHAAAGLEEERTQAHVECIDDELALGGGAALVGELIDLVQQHPYQEKLHAALMLALYRADRQAEALATYQRVRKALVAELGQEPGPALRELHQRILTSDDSLLSDAARLAGADLAPPAGRQCLPRTVEDFTGRELDLGWLLKAAGVGDSYVSPVLAIDGMPGVGKTTLAVRAAHLLRPDFPDGQLFVDRHGHSHEPPLDSSAALSTLLGQLGVPAGRIPTYPNERVARWRTELGARRVVLVLDNASSGAQVAPLLPTSGGCLALVTSRRRLVDLDGAHPCSVEILTPEEAITLLERIAGSRIRAKPAEAAEVAKRCGYLPLALRLAATRLAHRPKWQVRELADRLADPEAPFTELRSGDRSLASAFSLSYQQVSMDAQRTLRMVSLHPADTFDTHAAAAVTGSSLGIAQRVLDELVDAHLVEEPREARYRLHDLVRTFAAAVAGVADQVPDRRAAIGRLLDYYLYAAVTAGRSMDSELSRKFLSRDLPLGEPFRPDLLESPEKQGADYFEEERPTLLAVVRCAAAQGYRRHAWQLARARWRFLSRRGYLADILDTHQHGLAAAEQLGDTDAVAAIRNGLAYAFARTGDYDQAIVHMLATLDHRRAGSDRSSESSARQNLAITYAQAGHYREAAAQSERALDAARRSGDTAVLAMAVVNTGYLFLVMGRLSEALRHGRNGLLLAREVGDRQLIAIAVGNVGAVRARLGNRGPASRLLSAGYRACQRTKDRCSGAEALNELGMIDRANGNYDRAVARHREALGLTREAGLRQDECTVYNELGRTMHAAGDRAAALELHRRALDDSRRIGYRYGQAQALAGMAECLRDSDPAAARRHWQQALRILQELDHPDQHQVARHLTELAQVPQS
ncbi:MAG: BTAD domain-containing putative transcriptional regulator [Natronosporangium sp.]